MKHRALLFPVFLILFTVSAYAVLPPVPGIPSGHVVDLAGIVDDRTEGQLDAVLRELEEKTTAQVVVLTIRSLEGESLEDFSIMTAHDRWKLGQKGKDNGVLMVISLDDRKYRLEIGYGLEGVLPDSLAGTVGRDYLVPYFRQGDYSGGIKAATLAIVREIASSEGAEISGMPQNVPVRPAQRRGKSGGLLDKILGGLMVLVFVYLLIRHPRLLLFILLTSGRGGRGWGGGGGFGGGGGGFGGGGGGFGGGGSSGGW